jgi:hypothetical protein
MTAKIFRNMFISFLESRISWNPTMVNEKVLILNEFKDFFSGRRWLKRLPELMRWLYLLRSADSL